jgi:hypothetical protein
MAVEDLRGAVPEDQVHKGFATMTPFEVGRYRDMLITAGLKPDAIETKTLDVTAGVVGMTCTGMTRQQYGLILERLDQQRRFFGSPPAFVEQRYAADKVVLDRLAGDARLSPGFYDVVQQAWDEVTDRGRRGTTPLMSPAELRQIYSNYGADFLAAPIDTVLLDAYPSGTPVPSWVESVWSDIGAAVERNYDKEQVIFEKAQPIAKEPDAGTNT